MNNDDDDDDEDDIQSFSLIHICTHTYTLYIYMQYNKTSRLLIVILIIILHLVVEITSQEEEEEDSSSSIEFENWLRSKNVKTHDDVEIRTSNRGRGLYATKDLEENVVFAEIPLSSMINIEHVLRHPIVGPIANEVNDLFALALFLLHETNNSAYLQWLNLDVRASPMEWITKDTTLKRMSIGMEIERRRSYNLEILEQLKENKINNLTLFELERLVFLVQSRIHGVRVRHPITKKWHNTKCLVPFADAMNTDAKSNVNTECFTNQDSTHFVCRTKRPIVAGQELLSYYANRPNDILLLDYGFTLPASGGEVAVHLTSNITVRASKFEDAIFTLGSVEQLENALTRHFTNFISIEFPCGQEKHIEQFSCLSDVTKKRCSAPSNDENTRHVLRIAESECVTLSYLRTKIKSLLEI